MLPPHHGTKRETLIETRQYGRKAAGFLFAVNVHQLKMAVAGTSEDEDGNPVTVPEERIAFLKDYEDPSNPFQYAKRVTDRAVWLILSDLKGRLDLDTHSVFKRKWDWDMLTPHNKKLPANSFWDGVLIQSKETLEEFTKLHRHSESALSDYPSDIANTSSPANSNMTLQDQVDTLKQQLESMKIALQSKNRRIQELEDAIPVEGDVTVCPTCDSKVRRTPDDLIDDADADEAVHNGALSHDDGRPLGLVEEEGMTRVER
jgi:hypothetical protein